jgi:sRNA-binding carbon storage regulator CsrA
LVLDLRSGERISLDGDRIKVELLHKSGQLVRLRVVAPRDVKVERLAALS